MSCSRLWWVFQVLSFCAIACRYTPGALALWPMPRSLQTGNTSLLLSPSFSIDIQISDIPEDLTQAVARTRSYLKNDKLGRLVVGRGAPDLALLHGAKELQSLQLTLSRNTVKARSISSEAIAPLGSRSEEYSLIIPSTGSAATLVANSTLGLFRGLTTFEQLWYTAGEATYTLEAPINIVDSPAFVRRISLCDSLYSLP